MNVNLDVLELLFTKLDGPDLVAAALVSRAFLSGVIPSLYARIEYTPHHVKRAHHVMSPFATIAVHDHLAVHVKRVAIHAAPIIPSTHQVCPAFLKDLAHALQASSNVRSFVCTVKLLPPLLPHLLDKPRLRHLRICAPLGSRQVAVLQDLAELHSLALDFPSWNVIDALPKWTAAMQNTLVHLTLYMSQDIDATVLHATLLQLPRLRGLHVIGCPRITHVTILKALSHTPNLRELSLSIYPSQENALFPPTNFVLPPLTHLAIDVRASYPGLASLVTRIIARLSPRDALAICGGWIGEIKSSSELADMSSNVDNPGGGGQNLPQGPAHPQGQGHGNNQANDPPLLTPPSFVQGVAFPHGHGNPHPPNPGSPPPQPIYFGLPLPFLTGDPNGNNNGNGNGNGNGNNPPPNPLNPLSNTDPNLPSLISSLPLTLSVLHIPQVSPAGLRGILERCPSLEVLGAVLGSAFASQTSKGGKSKVREHPPKSGTRHEVCALSNVLAHARNLRELILDTSSMGPISNTGTDSRASESYSAPFSPVLLTQTAVRQLMRTSPRLRRIVGEGRVWESTTPSPSLFVPFPHCVEIELTLSKTRYDAGIGNNRTHGPSGFGSHGTGYTQVEVGNNPWFWLTRGESEGEVQCGS